MEDNAEHWEVPRAPQLESVDGDYVDILDIELDVADEPASRITLEDLDAQWFPTDDYRLEHVVTGAAAGDFASVVTALAELVSDYRADELGVGSINRERICRWVGQFGASDELQRLVLSELLMVLSRTYLTRSRIDSFYRSAIRSGHVTQGRHLLEFWSGVHLIDIADQTFLSEKKGTVRLGRSRSINCKRFRSFLKQEIGAIPEDDPERAHTFVYVDDLMCSGFQAKSEISAWMADYGAHQAPRNDKDVVIIVAAKHTGSDEWIKSNIGKCPGVADVRGLCTMSLESRPTDRDNADVYWPVGPSDDLRQGVESAFGKVRWRHGASRGKMELFSSADARRVLETELLTKGMSLCRESGADGKTRPFGRQPKGYGGLGLGTPIVTSENCPNSAPLALWMDTRNWISLFPRRSRQEFKSDTPTH